MKPYPLVGLNHFTVPVATNTLHCSHYGPTIIRQSADTGYGSKYKKTREPPRPRHHAASMRTPLARLVARVIDTGDPGPMSAMPPIATEFCGAAKTLCAIKDGVIGRP